MIPSLSWDQTPSPAGPRCCGLCRGRRAAAVPQLGRPSRSCLVRWVIPARRAGSAPARLAGARSGQGCAGATAPAPEPGSACRAGVVQAQAGAGVWERTDSGGSRSAFASVTVHKGARARRVGLPQLLPPSQARLRATREAHHPLVTYRSTAGTTTFSAALMRCRRRSQRAGWICTCWKRRPGWRTAWGGKGAISSTGSSLWPTTRFSSGWLGSAVVACRRAASSSHRVSAPKSGPTVHESHQGGPSLEGAMRAKRGGL